MKRWRQHQKAIKECIGPDIGTAELLSQRIQATFSRLDVSGDGYIDYSELKVVSIDDRTPSASTYLNVIYSFPGNGDDGCGHHRRWSPINGHRY
jgi:hypothetical protein